VINAIILAAGESKRMGKTKALLSFGETTFLGQIISVIKSSDVDRVNVVLGADAERIKKSVDLSGTEVVINKDYKKGQLSSLIAALESIPPATEAILVCLVDHPFISRVVINGIVSKFRETGSPIVIPVFEKKRGHPALFAASLFKELANAPAEEGARYVVKCNAEKVKEVEVEDGKVLAGINTPEDYRTYF
jgi:molybdenum cofactor cytidylyltransferase